LEISEEKELYNNNKCNNNKIKNKKKRKLNNDEWMDIDRGDKKKTRKL
jgi:hypothetical protein